MRLLFVALALLQAAALPPAYPRPGTTKLLENSRVLVWDISWLKQQYPLHRHPYDLVGVYYAPGDRVIVSTAGARRPVSTKAWEIAFQAKGVTHIEEGASDVPLKAVFVELKEESASDNTGPAAADGFPHGHGKQVLDNPRTTVWEFVPSSDNAIAHRHLRDAVVVAFNGDHPSVSFVAKGTTHAAENATGSDRMYVFELK